MDSYIVNVGSNLWLWGLLSTAVFFSIILWLPKVLTKNYTSNIRLGLAALYASNFFVFHIYSIYYHRWSSHHSLPLDLCSLSHIIGIYALVFKKQAAFEFVLYFGIAGGINSLLTPQLTHGYSHYYVLQYYIDHGAVILIPIFLGMYEKMKPQKYSWLKTMITINILAVVVYFINVQLGSNYMYVNAKPLAQSPLIIGEWPVYIFVLEIVALLHFYLIYVFFYKGRKWV